MLLHRPMKSFRQVHADQSGAEDAWLKGNVDGIEYTGFFPEAFVSPALSDGLFTREYTVSIVITITLSVFNGIYSEFQYYNICEVYFNFYIKKFSNSASIGPLYLFTCNPVCPRSAGLEKTPTVLTATEITTPSTSPCSASSPSHTSGTSISVNDAARHILSDQSVLSVSLKVKLNFI